MSGKRNKLGRHYERAVASSDWSRRRRRPDRGRVRASAAAAQAVHHRLLRARAFGAWREADLCLNQTPRTARRWRGACLLTINLTVPLFMQQMARSARFRRRRAPHRHRVLICDRDAKWRQAGRGHLGKAGLQIIQTPFRAPNASAHAERFVRSIKEECLDRLVPLGERHFRQVVAEYVVHYDSERRIKDGAMISCGPLPKGDRMSRSVVDRGSAGCSTTTHGPPESSANQWDTTRPLIRNQQVGGSSPLAGHPAPIASPRAGRQADPELEIRPVELVAEHLRDLVPRRVVHQHVVNAGLRVQRHLTERRHVGTCGDRTVTRHHPIERQPQGRVEPSASILGAPAARVVDQLRHVVAECERVAGGQYVVVGEEHEHVAVGMGAAEAVQLDRPVAKVNVGPRGRR